MKDSVVIKRCGYCGRELKIPVYIAEQVEKALSMKDYPYKLDSPPMKQYGEFYVSSAGGFYCSKECAIMFTED